ncbi:MAG TPA: sigma-70 family RNA polymerase sigma factor [Candidatus Paceibacterota bacterium]
MDTSDEDLISAYLGGDEPAFAELTRRHLSGVYSFIARFIGNAEEADDITQETFLKAWKSLKKYDRQTSKFKTWLLRIARNSAIDFLRKKKHVPFSQFDTEDGANVLTETVPDTEELPDALLIKLEGAKEVRKTLEQLPPKAREVLLLYYTNDLTFEDIGEMLGEPTNTVKSRHRRALQSLRKLVAPQST